MLDLSLPGLTNFVESDDRVMRKDRLLVHDMIGLLPAEQTDGEVELRALGTLRLGRAEDEGLFVVITRQEVREAELEALGQINVFKFTL